MEPYIIILLHVLLMLHHHEAQTIKQFEDTGSVHDNHAKGSNCSTSIHTEQDVSTAQEAIKRSPTKSV
jgi:hypothetical protein